MNIARKRKANDGEDEVDDSYDGTTSWLKPAKGEPKLHANDHCVSPITSTHNGEHSGYLFVTYRRHIP